MRVAFIEAVRRLKAELPGARTSGGVSNVSFAFRGNDRVREAIHSRLPVPRDRGRAGHGHRQRRRPAGVRRHRPRAPRARRGRRARPPSRRRPSGCSRSPRATPAERAWSAQPEDLAWRERPVGERLTHALVEGIDAWIVEDTEEARLAAKRPLDVIEGPLMDGHERRRRPVRLRADVPAPGGQERPGHEEGRGAPRAVSRGGARRRRGTQGGHDRDRDGQGRRPRHRQEHRRRRARLQRLRGRRPRGHGPRRPDPREG